MKTFFAMAIAAVSFAACDNAATDNTKVETTTTTNTTPNSTTNTNSKNYTARDGDVTYRENKVRVMRNGEWVNADNDVKLDNDVVVYKHGRIKKDNREVELKDGEIVNRTGDLFDRSGNAIENAWDATKEGAKDAGRAIKNTAEKVRD